MTRGKKLSLAALVLLAGLALAWPFRREGGATSAEVPAGQLQSTDLAARFPAPPEKARPTQSSHGSAAAFAPKSVVSAQSLAETPTSFDLVNHPALSHRGAAAQSMPVTPPVPPSPWPITGGQGDQSTTRPAYATVENHSHQWPTEVLHVVENGDTLEKLSQRYLGDEARALEIFEANRDQLANPHLLPIGAKLRIPVPPEQMVD